MGTSAWWHIWRICSWRPPSLPLPPSPPHPHGPGTHLARPRHPPHVMPDLFPVHAALPPNPPFPPPQCRVLSDGSIYWCATGATLRAGEGLGGVPTVRASGRTRRVASRQPPAPAHASRHPHPAIAFLPCLFCWHHFCWHRSPDPRPPDGVPFHACFGTRTCARTSTSTQCIANPLRTRSPGPEARPPSPPWPPRPPTGVYGGPPVYVSGRGAGGRGGGEGGGGER
jgi:hypothetical protein